jgi:hypothetical protein
MVSLLLVVTTGLTRATDDVSHRLHESGFQADKVHATIFEQIERFDEIFEPAPQPIELLSTRDPHRTVRLSTINVRNGSAVREMVCQFASPNGVKHVTVHSVALAQILLIQIILIRNNRFVKRKIGNLFETKADDGKLCKIGEVFSADGTW